MNTRLVLTAVLSSLLTLTAVEALPSLVSRTKLENARVKVTEITYAPGAVRPRYTRPTDQIIVFLDDAKYERTVSATGRKEIQQRKSGDLIWHHKGDDAPVLRNASNRPYRTVVVELK